MKLEHCLYLVDDELKMLTREEAIGIKLMYPEKDIWNVFNALDMEPIMMEEKNDTTRNK